jgi:hypothetical protein
VDAGPKFSNVRLDVVTPLDAIIFAVLMDGTVAGVLRKFRKPVRFCIARCALASPRTILLAAAKFCAEVNRVLIRFVETDPPTNIFVRIVVERRKVAAENVLRPSTVV